MPGIMANSATVTMGSGDTAAENTFDGYLANEMITLSTTPTGSSYSWGQALPSGATKVRCALSSTTAAAPTFTPDVAGEYVVTCIVDGTAYVLRMSVTAVATITMAQCFRLQQVTDAQVSTPAGDTLCLYNSSDQGGLTLKNSEGTVSLVGTSLVNTAADVTVSSRNTRVFVVGNTTAVEITLPTTPVSGQRVDVVDADGHAATYNITISGNGKLINGAATALMTANYEALTCAYNGTKWSLI